VDFCPSRRPGKDEGFFLLPRAEAVVRLVRWGPWRGIWARLQARVRLGFWDDQGRMGLGRGLCFGMAREG